MIRDYLVFTRANYRFLLFGFSLAFISSFGQTFYIALFSAEIRETFGLSHGGFGEIYSAVTLISGFLLMWLGKKLDDVALRPYVLALMVGLAAGAVAIKSMSGESANKRTNGPAHRESGGCPDDFAPNAHDIAPART